MVCRAVGASPEGEQAVAGGSGAHHRSNRTLLQAVLQSRESVRYRLAAIVQHRATMAAPVDRKFHARQSASGAEQTLLPEQLWLCTFEPGGLGALLCPDLD